MRVTIFAMLVLSALPALADSGCGAGAAAQVRTTLYFGLSQPAGRVSERQWNSFLRDVVTPLFPQGLTVSDAKGQWRGADGKIVREGTKVLTLIHDDTATTAIDTIADTYKRRFSQESVLVEQSAVCAVLK